MIVVLGEPVARWMCVYEECGASCCRVERSLTLRDILEIHRATGEAVEDFVSVSSALGEPNPFALKRVGGSCVFLQKDYRCLLHGLEAKPLLCRMYPFLLQRIVYGDEPVMVVNPASDCPGYGRGPSFDEEALREVKRHGEAYVKELRRLIGFKRQGMEPRDILAKALEAGEATRPT